LSKGFHDAVCIPTVEGDEFKSMTVIPYLEDLHFPDEENGDGAGSVADGAELGGVAFITERELNGQFPNSCSSSLNFIFV
jgi:hypothetical protein